MKTGAATVVYEDLLEPDRALWRLSTKVFELQLILGSSRSGSSLASTASSNSSVLLVVVLSKHILRFGYQWAVVAAETLVDREIFESAAV